MLGLQAGRMLGLQAGRMLGLQAGRMIGLQAGHLLPEDVLATPYLPYISHISPYISTCCQKMFDRPEARPYVAAASPRMDLLGLG